MTITATQRYNRQMEPEDVDAAFRAYIVAESETINVGDTLTCAPTTINADSITIAASWVAVSSGITFTKSYTFTETQVRAALRAWLSANGGTIDSNDLMSIQVIGTPPATGSPTLAVAWVPVP